MPIALIIALLLGGGTSVVAETSLPGDLLYKVKLNVNENIRSMVAVSAEAQAKWDARRIEKRLEEAEKLAEENRLDEETSVKIEANLDSHEGDLRGEIAKLSANNDHTASAEVNSNFRASLDAHQSILLRLEQRDPSLAARLRPIVLKLKTYSDSADRSRAKSESEISASGSVEVQASAEGKMKAAQNKIDEVAKFLERQKASVSAEVYASASVKLEVAKQAMIEGNAQLSSKNYGAAFSTYQRASRVAQEAKSVMTANLKLDLDGEIDITVNNAASEERRINNQDAARSDGSVEIRSETDVRLNNDKTETDGTVRVRIGL